MNAAAWLCAEIAPASPAGSSPPSRAQRHPEGEGWTVDMRKLSDWAQMRPAGRLTHCQLQLYPGWLGSVSNLQVQVCARPGHALRRIWKGRDSPCRGRCLLCLERGVVVAQALAAPAPDQAGGRACRSRPHAARRVVANTSGVDVRRALRVQPCKSFYRLQSTCPLPLHACSTQCFGLCRGVL